MSFEGWLQIYKGKNIIGSKSGGTEAEEGVKFLKHILQNILLFLILFKPGLVVPLTLITFWL